MKLTILSFFILLTCHIVSGLLHLPFGRASDYSPVSPKPSNMGESYGAIENFDIFEASSNRTEVNTTEASDATLRTEENNSTLPTSNQSVSSTYTSSASSSSPDTESAENSTTAVSNKSHSTDSSSSESSSATKKGTTSTTSTTTPLSNETNASTLTTDDDEPEGVARGKPSTTESVNITTAQPQTLYERGLALIGDPYTLSILVPVAAGVVFATTIILTLATCRCVRRRCIRRRLRRKTLPDSVKNLRPSDRARLLAETSDEEF